MMQMIHWKKLGLSFKVLTATMVLLVVVTSAYSVTYMWFGSKDSVQNAMALGRQSVIVTEEFTPVTGLYPGDEVRKIVGFTNEGDMDALVRVGYDEYWTSAGGMTISNTFWDAASSSVQDSMIKKWNAASGFGNAALWTDGGDGYYYYNKLLKVGEVTDPVLDSVMMNEKLLDSNKMIEYASAHYTLAFSVDSLSVYSDEATIKSQFGSYVQAAIQDDGSVVWAFA